MCTGGRAGVRYVITKFSEMDSLPNFLTHGAPLCARFARARSSAIIVISLHVERNEDHDDRKDQNDQNTTLTAFIVYTLKEKAFHVHGFIGLC